MNLRVTSSSFSVCAAKCSGMLPIDRTGIEDFLFLLWHLSTFYVTAFDKGGDNCLVKKPQYFVQQNFIPRQNGHMENVPLIGVNHLLYSLHTLLLEQKINYFDVLVEHSCQQGSPILTVNF